MHLNRMICQRLGVLAVQGAVVTFRFPFLTSYHLKMWTMAGQDPAIMQGPNNRNTSLFDVSAKHWQIQKPTVQIVKMNDVWLIDI